MSLLLLAFIAACALFLHLRGNLRLGCWLIVLSTALVGGGIVHQLSGGVMEIGQAAVSDSHRSLAICGVLIFFDLAAVLRPANPILFWIAWSLNGLLCIFIYDFYSFWKVFN